MTEFKLTIPSNIMWVFIGSILLQSLSNLALIKQRYDNDAAFMAKVKEIQDENAALRKQMGLR